MDVYKYILGPLFFYISGNLSTKRNSCAASLHSKMRQEIMLWHYKVLYSDGFKNTNPECAFHVFTALKMILK